MPPYCCNRCCTDDSINRFLAFETSQTSSRKKRRNKTGCRSVTCGSLSSSKNTPTAAFLARLPPFHCTVCLGAYGSPGGKRRATAFFWNPLLRKGSETTGRVSEANRGSRTAQSAPQSRSPKPTEGRDWAAIHAAGFGLTIGGLRPDHTSGTSLTV